MTLRAEIGRLKRKVAPTQTARELQRLWTLPDYQAGETTLVAPSLNFTFGRSVVMQYRAIFEERVYDFSPGHDSPIIIDCGANIGLAIRYWQGRWPGARIIAYEADPKICAVLRRNVTGAEIVEAAVWTKDTKLTFASEGGDAGRIGSGDLEVPAIRLRDRLRREPHIDLLKLDIEGAETEVLLDCGQDLGGVERIFVEYHSFTHHRQSLPDLLALLREAGYRVQVKHEWASPEPFKHQPEQYGMDLQLDIWAYR